MNLLLLTMLSAQAEPEWRIVGGQPADPGDWPSAAAVQRDGSFICSGVLVAPDVVLTAGHCDFDLTEVRLDSVDLDSGEIVAVAESFRHEDHWTTYDITAIKLAQPAVTEPVVLARDCITDVFLRDGAAVDVVGFGAIDTYATERPGLLYEAQTTVQNSLCDDVDRDCNESVMPGGELIAGGGGVDSCSGDSGGPLYLQTEVGTYLLGITSRAADPATVPCGDGGIYVRAEAVVDWIETVTGTTLASPDCSSFDNEPPVPTAPVLAIDMDTTGFVQVDPGDPNEEDAHSYVLTSDSVNGRAFLNPSGEVVYIPNEGFVGIDAFSVRVTDDGEPNMSGSVVVDVEVRWVEPVDTADTGSEVGGKGCGCSNSAGVSWILLLLATALSRRRRTPRRPRLDPSGR